MDFFKKLSQLLLWAFHEAQQTAKAKASTWINRRSLSTKILASFALLSCFVYLLFTSSQLSCDHAETGCVHVLIFLPTVRFTLSLLTEKFLALAFYLLRKYGLFRIVVHMLFLGLFSYLFCAVLLDNSAMIFADKATKFFSSRFDSNKLEVQEDRDFAEHIFPHPLTGGKHNPAYLHHFVRYPMEDVEMKCAAVIFGYPGGKPFINQVEWRRNGVPLSAMTDRHSHTTTFTEMNGSSVLNSKTGEAIGLSAYELKSTLSIYLLDDKDFGSYTCHVVDKVSISQEEWTRETGQTCSNTKRTQEKSAKGREKRKSAFSDQQCTCQPERKYFFQDIHTQIDEFRLIKMEPKTDQIEAPAGSVLFFTGAYLHLSREDEILSDYAVNGVSFRDLCDGRDYPSYGCSVLQRFLTNFIYDQKQSWWFLRFLPLLVGTKLDKVGSNFTTGLCLCENSFGRHNLNILRKYYNRTRERYELLEITHPYTLLVRPPKQRSTNFFSSFWEYGPMQLLPLADHLPEYVYDLTLLKDLAVVSMMLLNVTDAVIIGMGLGTLVCISFLILYSLRVVGIVSKKLCLHGSMGYLNTAGICSGNSKENDQTHEILGEEKFDMYLSHSDSTADQTFIIAEVLPLLEAKLGLKTCLRDRDIPPNELELAGLSRTIQNSKRFLIFLTKDFLEDACREMETAVILETLFDRPCRLDDALVIKLEDCQTPAHYLGITAHNWTSSNLTIDDQKLRLVNWIADRTERKTSIKSLLDAFMTTSPLLLTICVFVWTLFH